MYLENLTPRNGSFARSMQGVLLAMAVVIVAGCTCLLYTSPSPRD